MSQLTICRLCLKECNDFKSIYHTNGQANELYDMIYEMLHPKIVDLEAAEHLNGVCLACVGHLDDFHQFQKSILVAQEKLQQKNPLGVVVKTEIEDVMPEDLQNVEAILGAESSSSKFFQMQDEEEIITEDFQQPQGFQIKKEIRERYDYGDNISQNSESAEPANFAIQPKLEIMDVPGEEQSESESEKEEDTCQLPTSVPSDGHMDETNTRSNCDICNTSFSTRRNLLRHLRNLHGIRQDASSNESSKIDCKICGNSFGRRSNYVAHMRWQHGPSASSDRKKWRIHCEFCTNTFSSRYNLEVHMKYQHGLEGDPNSLALEGDIDYDETTKKFCCKICGQFFTYKIRLVRHIERSHPDLHKLRTDSDAVAAPKTASSCEVYKCRFCDHASVFKLEVAMHMETQHGISAKNFELEADGEEDATTFKCKLCPATFSFMSALRKHMEITHRQDDVLTQKLEFEYDDISKLVKCKQCGNSEKNVHSLVVHMAQNHWKTEIPKSECEICQQAFETKVELAQHYCSVHCPPGLYPCTDCGSTFKKEKLLKKHRKEVHSTTSKKYKCNICQKLFRSGALVKKHMVTHTRIRSFPCPMCPTELKHSNSFKRHMRLTHHQENWNLDQLDDDDCVEVAMESMVGEDEAQSTVVKEELSSE